MKVVLDTNVVVSGTFWTGSSFRILELVNKGKIRIITSLPILREYDRVIHSEEILDKTTVYQQARIKATLNILNNNIIVEPNERLARGYLNEAKASLERAEMNFKDGDLLWTTVVVYYAEYYSLYSFL